LSKVWSWSVSMAAKAWWNLSPNARNSTYFKHAPAAIEDIMPTNGSPSSAKTTQNH
jgi:hypothetical protein